MGGSGLDIVDLGPLRTEKCGGFCQEDDIKIFGYHCNGSGCAVALIINQDGDDDGELKSLAAPFDTSHDLAVSNEKDPPT